MIQQVHIQSEAQEQAVFEAVSSVRMALFQS